MWAILLVLTVIVSLAFRVVMQQHRRQDEFQRLLVQSRELERQKSAEWRYYDTPAFMRKA